MLWCRTYKTQTISRGRPLYAIGVYGSGATCSALLDRDLAIYTWLAESRGWLGFGSFNRWSIKQGLEVTIGGLEADAD
jgi:hypothetical protein